MMWVAGLLALGVAVWFFLAIRQERTERISMEEMVRLTEAAPTQPELARALAHREAIRDHVGDPDGSDPVVTDVDRSVRAVARVADRLVKARRRRARALARQQVVGVSMNKSVQGSGSADEAIDGSSRSLGEAAAQLEGEIAAWEEEAERLLGELAALRERAESRPAQRRARQEAAEVSGLRDFAARAAHAYREITSPGHRLATAAPGPAPAPPIQAAPPSPPAQVQRAPAQAQPAPPPAAAGAPAAAAAPPAVVTGSPDHREGRSTGVLALGKEVERPPHREPTRLRGARVLGRRGSVPVRTSPAVKPLSSSEGA